MLYGGGFSVFFALPVGDEALCCFAHCGDGTAVFADRGHDERDCRRRRRDDLRVFSFIRSRILPSWAAKQTFASALMRRHSSALSEWTMIPWFCIRITAVARPVSCSTRASSRRMANVRFAPGSVYGTQPQMYPSTWSQPEKHSRNISASAAFRPGVYLQRIIGCAERFSVR